MKDPLLHARSDDILRDSDSEDTRNGDRLRTHLENGAPESPEEHAETATISLMAGTFFHGDNLDVLRTWFPEEIVDLVYLDPPFNSDQDFNLPFGVDEARPAQKKRGFTDTWMWDPAAIDAYDQVTKTRAESMPDKLPGVMRALHDFLYPRYRHIMLAYLANMAVRLVELRRVMKPTASLYLHCDPTASHYLKMILDSIFGLEYFRGEITWKRTFAHSSTKGWAPVHDVLLFYTKGREYTWNTMREKPSQETADGWYNNIEDGTGKRFNRESLLASGTRTGSSGKPWRGIDPTKKGRHWAIPGIVRSLIGDLDTLDALDALDKAGRIFWPQKATGQPMFKRYLSEAKGPPIQDVITDIARLHNVSAERVHYPTQKPVALLSRIVEASSKPGDLILDPFCGCGTTVIACEQLSRRWIGIDIGDQAIKTLREQRIPKEAPDAVVTVKVEPFDPESIRLLAALDEGYEFQWWVVRKLGGQPPGGKMKKGSDRGQDGEIFVESTDEFQRRHRVIISVKSGEKQSVGWVNDLAATVNNPAHKAHMGILVTLDEPKRNLRDRAREYLTVPGSAHERRDYDKIQVVSADELLKVGPACLALPGRNVTPPWTPTLPVPERAEQVPLPVDRAPRRDRARRAAVVADNTGKVADRVRTVGPKRVPSPAAQREIPGVGGTFRLVTPRGKPRG
jgi:DNA modification methylase